MRWRSVAVIVVTKNCCWDDLQLIIGLNLFWRAVPSNCERSITGMPCFKLQKNRMPAARMPCLCEPVAEGGAGPYLGARPLSVGT